MAITTDAAHHTAPSELDALAASWRRHLTAQRISPSGYKVTGGGYDARYYGGAPDHSKPYLASGRQGWSAKWTGTGSEDGYVTVRSICMR